MGLQQPNGRPLLIDGQHVDRMTAGIGEWPEPGLTDPIQFVIIETPTRPMMPFMSNTHVPHNRPRSRLPYFNTWAESIGNVPGKRLPQPSQGWYTGHQGVMMGVAERTSFPLSVTCSQRVVTTLPELGWRIQPISLGICTRIFD